MTYPSPPPPPPGWRVFSGELICDETILGHLQRKQGVRGACYTRDCRRNYSLDFELLLRRGFAQVPMKELKRLLRCNMPGGCAITFQDERQGSGLPLSVIAANPSAGVRLRCLACRWEKVITPSQAIRRLTLAKTGDASTLHTDLVSKLNKPCPKCAQTRWACDILWPAPPQTHERVAKKARNPGDPTPSNPAGA